MRRRCNQFRKYLPVGIIWATWFRFIIRISSFSVVTFLDLRMLRMYYLQAVFFYWGGIIFRQSPLNIHHSTFIIPPISPLSLIFISGSELTLLSGLFATFGSNIMRLTVIFAFWYLYTHNFLPIDIFIRFYMNPPIKDFMNGTSTVCL